MGSKCSTEGITWRKVKLRCIHIVSIDVKTAHFAVFRVKNVIFWARRHVVKIKPADWARKIKLNDIILGSAYTATIFDSHTATVRRVSWKQTILSQPSVKADSAAGDLFCWQICATFTRSTIHINRPRMTLPFRKFHDSQNGFELGNMPTGDSVAM